MSYLDICLSLLASSGEARKGLIPEGEPWFELEFDCGLNAFDSYSEFLLFASSSFIKNEDWGEEVHQVVADGLLGLLAFLVRRGEAGEIEELLLESEEGNAETLGLDLLIRDLARKLLRVRKKKVVIPEGAFDQIFLVSDAPWRIFSKKELYGSPR